MIENSLGRVAFLDKRIFENSLHKCWTACRARRRQKAFLVDITPIPPSLGKIVGFIPADPRATVAFPLSKRLGDA
jgi:hypothetical protein